MRFRRTILSLIFVIIFCCACDNRPVVIPTQIAATITMTAGKDFDCWTAEAPAASESSKPENMLIFSSFWENNKWKTSLFNLSLLTETAELEATFPDELGYKYFSPNSRYIFYNIHGDGFNDFIYDRLKTTRQKIPNITELNDSLKWWSKDSQCLFIQGSSGEVLDKKIFAYQIDDNTLQEKDIQEIPEILIQQVGKPSPDGKFTVRQCPNSKNICLSNADGQSINHPALELDTVIEKYAMVSLYGWSPDSRMLLFGFSTGQELMAGYINTLRLVFLDENGVQKYTDFYSYSRAIWAPDGKSILMLGGDKEFDIYEISTENSKKFIPPRGYSDEMTWLPDSKQIIFISENQKSLYWLDIDRGDFVKLDADIGYIKEMFLVP